MLGPRQDSESSSGGGGSYTGRGGVKMYRCKTCFAEFAQRGALKQHNEAEHSIHRVPCDECSKTFTTRSSLRLHKEAIHDGIRYRCNHCDKSFGQLGSLRRHMKAIHPTMTLAPGSGDVMRARVDEFDAIDRIRSRSVCNAVSSSGDSVCSRDSVSTASVASSSPAAATALARGTKKRRLQQHRGNEDDLEEDAGPAKLARWTAPERPADLSDFSSSETLAIAILAGMTRRP